MDYLNQIFSIFATYHEQQSLRFNSNFLEANVINIALLLFGLIYVLKQFLGSILVARQEKVLSAIQESEERLQQANIRLAESEKQLAQTQIVINQIIQEAESIAQKVRQSILDQGKSDIERLTIASKASISTAESQVRQQIQQQITALAISKVTLQLQNQVTSAMQATIIDSNIAQLGE
uniref:ATP synthase subunit b, chloroplastic n=2 Tax=Grateloupia TaxID=31454 RepID=A0A6F8UPQ5_9FLOR|nr:ATP synthase subunit b [Grateloupia filicina]AWD77353.1 ATP synthase subunit b [Grateloupia filicina]BCB15073.1 ATP synthase subunit b [Grateloupia asiatica]